MADCSGADVAEREPPQPPEKRVSPEDGRKNGVPPRSSPKPEKRVFPEESSVSEDLPEQQPSEGAPAPAAQPMADKPEQAGPGEQSGPHDGAGTAQPYGRGTNMSSSSMG